MTLKGNDLVITDATGQSQGYVLCLDKQYGEPVIHSKSAPNVPLNIGSSTPAQAGGQYDVRDSDGDKAISHIDWTLGAGQRSLDADGATPFKFVESKCVDISKPGEISLLRGCTYTETALVKGPVFSAMGYFWLGMNYMDDVTPHNVLMHSLDGITWTHPTITASPAISGLISCFASDGTNVYFGVATGANKGIWRGVFSGTWTFTKYGSSGSTEEIKGLAFNGGQLFASVYTTATPPVSRVAQVDRATGVCAPLVTGSKLCTPAMFNAVNHIALVAAGNSVYWVVSQSNKSFIYKITYEPDTGAMMTEQYMEMPTGFIATCALGYLSTIYVGGYFESQTAGVGKGAVYVCADGYSAPLFEIGDRPEDTPIPSVSANDNRINAICEAGKDLYVATNRGAYRWDIDGGGFSHSYDLNSGGAGVSQITWNPGSEYSYDGSDMTNPADPGPEHGEFPSKWTVTKTKVYDGNAIGVMNVNAPNKIINNGADCWFYMSSSGTNVPAYDWSEVTALDLYNTTTIRWTNQTTTLTNLACSWDNVTKKMTLTGRNIQTQTWPASGPRIRKRTGVPFCNVSWSHNNGMAVMDTGLKTVFTTVPDGADALNNATGSTMEFLTGSGFTGLTNYTVQDGAKIVRFVMNCGTEMRYIMLPDGTVQYINGSAAQVPVQVNKAYMLNKFESVVCTGYTTYSDYNWTTKVWSYWYNWTWAGSGNWYWWDDTTIILPAPWGDEGRTPSVSNPVGEYRPSGMASPPSINITHPATIRCTVLGNNAEMSVNGDLNTKLSMSLAPTMYNDATKHLTLECYRGAAIDSWSLNSKSGYPAQNEVEVLGYAGIAYNKGKIMSPYIVTSDSTSGIALTGSEFAESGFITQSETSFHSGTLKKDFRSLDVAHTTLPAGSVMRATVWIDGEATMLSARAGTTKTRFPINQQGYSIKTSISFTQGTDKLTTPVIKAINVMWDFVKIKKHQYNLHCTEGAKNGTWRDNPQDAIKFLYATADKRASFEDAFVGQYEGAITDVSFLEANPSTQEGYSGVLKVIVREADE